ncbi:MAG: transposase [Acidimicrobiia bacterium]|nr:transposase [Acidimicrobiia bacterium]
MTPTERYGTPEAPRRAFGTFTKSKDPNLASEFTHRLPGDLQDRSLPPDVNRLGRTIARWATQITNWHHSAVTNGPTEGLTNLIKRIKRAAFGFRKLRQLQNPSTPIRRETQLETPRHHHSPLKSEEPPVCYSLSGDLDPYSTMVARFPLFRRRSL